MTKRAVKRHRVGCILRRSDTLTIEAGSVGGKQIISFFIATSGGTGEVCVDRKTARRIADRLLTMANAPVKP